MSESFRLLLSIKLLPSSWIAWEINELFGCLVWALVVCFFGVFIETLSSARKSIQLNDVPKWGLVEVSFEFHFFCADHRTVDRAQHNRQGECQYFRWKFNCPHEIYYMVRKERHQIVEAWNVCTAISWKTIKISSKTFKMNEWNSKPNNIMISEPQKAHNTLWYVSTFF